MARFDQAFIDQVRQASDIVEIVGEYIRLEKRGKDFWGLCPFHSEKSPSFSVAPDKQFFYCFGCHAQGNAFDFVMHRENIGFPAAIELLAKRARIALPTVERSPEEEAAQRERDQSYAALDLAASYFQHMLGEAAGAVASEYLQRRGVSSETQRRFRLGYAPPGWDGLLRSLRSRYPEPVLFRVGLLSRREQGDGYYDRFRDRVMFPIADGRGRVIGFGGRVMSGENVAKYLNSPESPLFTKRRTLYAFHLAREAIRTKDQAIIVEGYMDAITAQQAGVTNVVASLGTALTPEQARSLREQCSEVTIAYDADAAGQAATLRGLDQLVAAGCSVKILRLPQGKDPDELIRTQGPEPFIAAVSAAVPLLEFKLRLAIERHQGLSNEAERQTKVIREILPVLSETENEVQREVYIGLVARLLTRTAPEEAMISNAIRRELRQAGRPGSAAPHKGSRIVENISDVPANTAKTNRPNLTDPIERAETFALQLVLHHPQLFPQVVASLGAQPFSHPWLAAVASALAEVPLDAAAAAGVLEHLTDQAVRTFVAELALAPVSTVNPERDVVNCISNIRKHRIQRRIDELEKLIGERSAAGEDVLPTLLELGKLKADLKRTIK